VTDTGAFQFSNVNPHTLMILSKLLEHGAPGAEIIKKVYRAKPLEYLRLFAKVINTMKKIPDSNIVTADLTREMLESCGIEKKDIQTLTEDLNCVKDTDIFIFFKEMEKGKIRVSLRSNNFVVNGLAKKFGGGGHPGAAAFYYYGSLESAHREVLSALEQVMKKMNKVKTGG